MLAVIMCKKDVQFEKRTTQISYKENARNELFKSAIAAFCT